MSAPEDCAEAQWEVGTPSAWEGVSRCAWGLRPSLVALPTSAANTLSCLTE